VRVSSVPVRALIDRIDYLFPLDGGSCFHVADQMTPETKIVGDVTVLERDVPKLREQGAAVVELPIAARTKELGNGAGENTNANDNLEATALAGVAVGLFVLGVEDADLARIHETAFRLGHALGVEMEEGTLIARYLRSNKKEVLRDGNSSLALGLVAGGCNFAAAQSLSPGSLFRFFEDNAGRFGVVTLRGEDEKAAACMGLGAAYEGARALCAVPDAREISGETPVGGVVSTAEALRLAGVYELPLVVHLRHEEAAFHLEQAEFYPPHIVYAPTSVESAFDLGARAFVMAERFRVPVAMLTDPSLLETSYDVEPDPQDLFPVKAPQDRGSVASDEEKGMRGLLVVQEVEAKANKTPRQSKFDAIREDALPPRLFGSPQAPHLIVSWGTLQEPLLEALRLLKTEPRFKDPIEKVALLSCEQIFPFSKRAESLMRQARRLIFIDNDAGGRFTRLICLETGLIPTDRIVRDKKEPFSVEDLEERLRVLFAPPPEEGQGAKKSLHSKFLHSNEKASRKVLPSCSALPVLPIRSVLQKLFRGAAGADADTDTDKISGNEDKAYTETQT
jgi:2-oxoglutarate ferredoxin oxidoreductase subunit alpha